jgi:hypothetical protein
VVIVSTGVLTLWWRNSTLPGMKRVDVRCPAFAVRLLAFLCLMHGPAALAQARTVPELDALQAKFDAAVQSTAQGPYQTKVDHLNQRSMLTLDQAIRTAQQGGALDDVLAYQGDKARLQKGEPLPDADTSPVSGVKGFRKMYQSSLAKIVEERDSRMKPLWEAHDRALAALVQSLTKAGRIEDAAFVGARRAALLSDAVGTEQFKGTWDVRYTRVSGIRRYRINGTGKLDLLSGERVQTTVQITKKGGDYMIDFNEGKLERLSMKDGKLIVEHYNPASLYPTQKPSHLGAGTKVD